MRRFAMRIAVLGLAVVLGASFLGAQSDAATVTSATAAATSSQPDCGGEKPADPTGGTYTCTFTDDFTGSTYDTSKWMAQDTSFSGMTSENNDCYVDSPDTVSVSGGAAHITARKLAKPFTCHSPFGDFTTQTEVGTLLTKGHFSQAYGRFEFRARFPKTLTAGVHSALWLYPATNTYGVWPNSGEIDVAEWFSNAPYRAFPSVHYNGEVPFQSTGMNCWDFSPSSYHTYAVDWTPTTMYFYVDKTMCFSHSWLNQSALPGSAPFDQPFDMVLTQVFGGGTNAVTAATTKVATMDVDWVRAWQSSGGTTGADDSSTTSTSTSGGASKAVKQTVRGIGKPLHFVHR